MAVLGTAIALLLAPLPAMAQSLLELYEAAHGYDATYLAARALADSAQYRVEQTRALMRPSASISGSGARVQTNPTAGSNFGSNSVGVAINGRQPLFNRANTATIAQSERTLESSLADLDSAEQDLMLRVSQAYFDVLGAQNTLQTTGANKTAIAEQLASAKRNFEVGTATITDTNDAQAKYDQIVAQELSVQNDLDNRLASLAAIIGRPPKELKRFRGGFQPELPTPNAVDRWIEMAMRDNPQVQIAKSNYDIAVLEVDRQRAGHLPTLDLVASFNQAYQGASASVTVSSAAAFDSRLGIIGVQLNVPLYLGGSIDSRVRQAVANLEATRQNLEAARRAAQLLTQTSFTGVTSGFAQIKALEQAGSARVSTAPPKSAWKSACGPISTCSTSSSRSTRRVSTWPRPTTTS
jgi:outer membrane protein